MLIAYLQRQREWSAATFGKGFRTKGIADHIRKELVEIEKRPHDLMEWIDVLILGLDGYWRAGGSPERLEALLHSKQNLNMTRKWPASTSEDLATEHDRTVEVVNS